MVSPSTTLTISSNLKFGGPFTIMINDPSYHSRRWSYQPPLMDEYWARPQDLSFSTMIVDRKMRPVVISTEVVNTILVRTKTTSLKGQLVLIFLFTITVLKHRSSSCPIIIHQQCSNLSW
ncbi:hypothetical protein P8452_55513 [Trifolium repens]|nr:hypothetical protein P8452_55513 [Trifolium repens]